MFVKPETSGTKPSCFWIQLWRPVDPNVMYHQLLWQSEQCIAPGQTYEYVVVIITEHVDVLSGDFFGWTCAMNARCPMYYDVNIKGKQYRYGLGFGSGPLPSVGEFLPLALRRSEVWSIGVDIDVPPSSTAEAPESTADTTVQITTTDTTIYEETSVNTAGVSVSQTDCTLAPPRTDESTATMSQTVTHMPSSTPPIPPNKFPIWLIALLVVLGILALLMTLLCLLRKTCWAQRAVTPDDLRKTLEDDVLKDSISKSPISSIDIDIDYTPDDISINENKFTEQLIAVERKLQEIPQMPPDMEDIPAPAFTREHTLYYV